LDSVTASLGRELRKFRDVVCEAFETVELEKEENARIRRQNRAKAKKGPSASGSTGTANDDQHPSGTYTQPPNATSNPLTASKMPAKKKKTLNMATYKFHALGDYATTIRMFGTTDSYSTQTARVFVFIFIAK
jgi:hypothetical protein